MTVTKAGHVALVGRPNVGKSTLINALLKQKISITSHKPQTTRWQILGIKKVKQAKTTAQIIYIDTPGIHEHEKFAMNRYMNRIANSVLLGADIIIFMIVANKWHKEDQLVLGKLQTINKPVLLVLNKVDLIKEKAQLLPWIEKMQAKFGFTHIIPLSALRDDNIDVLEKTIVQLLPESPQLYPDEQITDKSVRFQLAEIIREKIILTTHQELPYATAVEIEHFQQEDKCIHINAIIWVERAGQKIIIIGKKGEQLKKIGTKARREIETLLKQKVFLRVWVKIKDHWTDDERALKSLGYE